MLDEKHPNMGEAPKMFLDKYAEDLERIFRDSEEYKKRDSFIAFGEFLGPNSFAGSHEDADVKDVILFDIWIYKVGMIGPREFINNFGHLDIPKIIYEGDLNTEFVEKVRKDEYGLHEGVICKWGKTGKWKKDLWMCKIKTEAYIERLKAVYGTGKYTDSSGDTHLTNDDG